MGVFYNGVDRPSMFYQQSIVGAMKLNLMSEVYKKALFHKLIK